MSLKRNKNFQHLQWAWLTDFLLLHVSQNILGPFFQLMPSIMLNIFFQRVLTAEFVDACKVDDVEGLKQRGLDVADVSPQ